MRSFDFTRRDIQAQLSVLNANVIALGENCLENKIRINLPDLTRSSLSIPTIEAGRKLLLNEIDDLIKATIRVNEGLVGVRGSRLPSRAQINALLTRINTLCFPLGVFERGEENNKKRKLEQDYLDLRGSSKKRRLEFDEELIENEERNTKKENVENQILEGNEPQGLAQSMNRGNGHHYYINNYYNIIYNINNHYHQNNNNDSHFQNRLDICESPDNAIVPVPHQPGCPGSNRFSMFALRHTNPDCPYRRSNEFVTYYTVDHGAFIGGNIENNQTTYNQVNESPLSNPGHSSQETGSVSSGFYDDFDAMLDLGDFDTDKDEGYSSTRKKF